MNKRISIHLAIVIGLLSACTRIGLCAAIPKAVERFHSIIVSEDWNRLAELKQLIQFPIKVREVVYLSGECDSKCTQFVLNDYASLKPILRVLHEAWTDKGDHAESYAPFAPRSENGYGVVFWGDCGHLFEVVVAPTSGRIESINVDGTSLAENESLKKFISGKCKRHAGVGHIDKTD